MRLRRTLIVLLFALAAGALIVPAAQAGSPHFVDSAFSAVRSGDTLTVSGKEAGLGDESQIVVIVSGDAACLNPGGNFPEAANKQTFSTTVNVPVQSGKADYTVVLEFAVQPRCNPPMSLVIGNVAVTDATNQLVFTFPGTF
jgi:hypothetical protein